MHKLTQFRLCPHSRSIRVLLAELDVEVELAEERPWENRPQFLALNPAGDLPVLEIESGPILCGSYAISEYASEAMKSLSADVRPVHVFPGAPDDRAEVRRLADWFHRKFDREVTRELLFEKVYGPQTPGLGHSPDSDVLRAIRSNLRYHLSYLGYLAHQRRWLAGDEFSFADIAAGAHLATVDYLNEVPWDEHPVVKAWYQRIKSRPSFRAILADRIPGAPAPLHYADLDF